MGRQTEPQVAGSLPPANTIRSAVFPASLLMRLSTAPSSTVRQSYSTSMAHRISTLDCAVGLEGVIAKSRDTPYR